MFSVLKRKVRSEFSLESGRNVSFLNPYSYLVAREHNELFDELDDIYIDGQLLVRVLRGVGFKSVKRYSFDNTSLAPVVFSDCVKTGKTIYIIGSSPEQIEQSIDVIKTQYPDLDILGYRCGYFNTETEKQDTLTKIKELNPDVVIAGMGTPLQEQFNVNLRQVGWKGTTYTCGGFLHQITQGLDYYPKIFDTLNIRWVYRIYDEPKLMKRYFLLYPKALVLFFYDFYKHKNSSAKKLAGS